MSQWQPSWPSYPKANAPNVANPTGQNQAPQDPLYTYGIPGKYSRPSFSNDPENPPPANPNAAQNGPRQPLYSPNPLSQPSAGPDHPQQPPNPESGLSSSPYQYMQYPLQQPPILPPGFQASAPAGPQDFHGDQWDPAISSAEARNGSIASRSLDKTSRQSRSSVDQSSPETSGRSSSSDQAKPRSASGGSVTKRSRMGCLTCRQRKKRCCETRPKCSECLRLRLNCVWPKPGTEHKNKSKEVKSQENTMDHDVYGKIKVLRGIVEYRSA